MQNITLFNHDQTEQEYIFPVLIDDSLMRTHKIFLYIVLMHNMKTS